MGSHTYLSQAWNYLDLFIVILGIVELLPADSIGNLRLLYLCVCVCMYVFMQVATITYVPLTNLELSGFIHRHSGHRRVAACKLYWQFKVYIYIYIYIYICMCVFMQAWNYLDLIIVILDILHNIHTHTQCTPISPRPTPTPRNQQIPTAQIPRQPPPLMHAHARKRHRPLFLHLFRIRHPWRADFLRSIPWHVFFNRPRIPQRRSM
jgi:hypothetical protein